MKRSGIVLFLLAALPAALLAAFPSTEEAGFRHCALVYLNNRKDAEFFKPMLMDVSSGRPTRRGFDAFLFLSYLFASGEQAEYGHSVKADWQAMLDGYFGDPAVYVPALAAAVRELGCEKPEVMFSISWLHPETADFGDVDGDGVSEDLSTPDGRAKVMNWFMDEVVSRMAEYPELKLWGFYFMREGLDGSGAEVARQMCDLVHARGFKTLWIPYYHAHGYREARSIGFDVVLMQSNWIFQTWENGGSARRNRFLQNAEEARSLGLGVELELYSTKPTRRQKQIFREEMEDAWLSGAQFAPCAYYLGDFFALPSSPDPDDRLLYREWMDFINGERVVAPRAGEWERTPTDDGSVAFMYTFGEPTAPFAVDVFFHDPPDGSFSGTVTVSAVRGGDSGNAAAEPLAWCVCPKEPTGGRRHRNVTLFTPETTADALAVSIVPDGGEPRVYDLNVEPRYPDMPAPRRPKSGPPAYPDESGRDLLDGVTAGNGFAPYVGWNWGEDPVAIVFDFAEPIELEKVRCHICLLESAAIRAPKFMLAAATPEGGLKSLSGDGAPPTTTVIGAEAERVGSVVEFNFPAGTRTRYLTVFAQPDAWFFLSEVEFPGLSPERLEKVTYEFSRPPDPQF